MTAVWTDEVKKKVIEEYKEREPTPENSYEIVKELADEFDKTPNGVMQVLIKAEVYVKKDNTAKTTSKTKRVSKEDSLNKLREAIENVGQEPDEEILGKITGKVAQYFATVIEQCD